MDTVPLLKVIEMYGDENRSKTILYTAVFAALIAAGGWISLPFFAVPFTLQTFFILLAAAVMKERAVLPVLLYVSAGLLGLPVFHNGSAGIGILLSPSGGFLIGFIISAFAAGYFFARQKNIAAVVSAILIYDTTAVLWFMVTAASPFLSAVITCVLPFLPADILKGIVAVFAAKRLWRIQND